MIMKQQSTAPEASPAKPEARHSPRRPPAHVTFAACCLVFFVSIIFLHNHNSMAYVHSTIVYSLEAPAGWLQSTSRTTVRGVIIKSGEDITRAAVTATTTTTTVATQAADDSSSTQETPGRPHLKHSIASSMWGHLSQHSAVHAAQLAAATAKAELPVNSVQSDIELQPQQVAQLVQQATAAGKVSGQGTATEATTAAEKHAGLYGTGGAGSVVFEPHSDLSSCPEGTAAPQGAAAVILLADSSSGPAVFRRALDGLMLLYSQGSADIRAAFHLYIGLDGDDADMQQLAHQYALDSLGTLKLVHHKVTNANRRPGSASRAGQDSSSSSEQQGRPGGKKPQGASAHSSTVHADHVRMMLHVFLQCFQYQSVLLLENDWKLLPDFFEYFDATNWLLGSDPSVYCISAWNPLGQQQPHSPSTNMARVQRADTNPGRGWLLGKATGLQLLKTWPQLQDMDWQQHIHSMGLQYGQQCIVPDVPRMLPASVHDTAAGAHIVAVATASGADGATEVQALLPANEQESDSSSVPSAVAADAGVVDQQAANAPEVAWASATAAVADDVAKAGGRSPEAVQGQPKYSWLGRDMSHLLAPGYRKWLQQRLLAAKAVGVTTAAQLTSRKKAVRVAYKTAAELVAAAEALGVPLTLSQGSRYCYSLPSTPVTQHCQDYLPDMAFEGVVTAHTQHGVRVYLVHLAYINALQGVSSSPGTDAGADKPVPAAVPATAAARKNV